MEYTTNLQFIHKFSVPESGLISNKNGRIYPCFQITTRNKNFCSWLKTGYSNQFKGHLIGINKVLIYSIIINDKEYGINIIIKK